MGLRRTFAARTQTAARMCVPEAEQPLEFVLTCLSNWPK
jgi:hypothetical protein